MSQFLKKQSAGFWFSIVTFILEVIALCFYIANSLNSYFNDLQAQSVLMTVIAIVVEAGIIIVSQVLGEKRWLDIGFLLVPVLLAVSLMIFISNRVTAMGIILGSNLAKGDMTAHNALNQAFMGFGAYFAAIVISLVSSFLGQGKRSSNAQKAESKPTF